MIDLETARHLCLAFPETEELDHFGKLSYRVKNKIFATLWLNEKRAVIKLSPVSQSGLCELKADAFLPVKGAWGKKGWTQIELDKISRESFMTALTAAWCEVAPKKLSEKFSQKNA